MKIIRAVEGGESPEGSVLTLGVYDGVHLGHKKIISEVSSEAAKRGMPSAAVTFNPHPSHILPGESAGLITDERQKLELLAECGLDLCVILNFTEEFSRKTAEDFVRDIIAGFMKAESVIVGFNHVFGAGRRGNARMLADMGEKHGFSLKLVKPVKINGETVSSSKIRGLIAEGRLEKANIFLGRSFSISGRVIKGDGKGRTLGFPTANIETPPGMVSPAPGVYAGRCFTAGEERPAVFYMGEKPTFGPPSRRPSMEIHIIGFSGNLYGKEIRFSFTKRLRGDMKFTDAEALRRKIENDVKKAANMAG